MDACVDGYMSGRKKGKWLEDTQPAQRGLSVCLSAHLSTHFPLCQYLSLLNIYQSLRAPDQREALSTPRWEGCEHEGLQRAMALSQLRQLGEKSHRGRSAGKELRKHAVHAGAVTLRSEAAEGRFSAAPSEGGR